MKIHSPTVKSVLNDSKESFWQVSAQIDSAELWFRLNEASGLVPSADLDPFVVAVLLVAMQKKEDIEVVGKISKRLLEGLEKYQDQYHDWFPKRFHKIKVHTQGFHENTPTQALSSAVAFSGGVDSFYSFLKLPRVQYGLFMAGFDMPLSLKDSIRELTDSYQELFREQGKTLVVGSTNIRQFVNTVDWTNAHGQALAASALFFKQSWSHFYIPSSYTSESYPKWGTHPDLDPFLSTESLQMVHHGSEANRVQKLVIVTEYPETYSRLRVCWIQDIGLRNCGKCEKCIRTQIALELLGKLKSYTVFPVGALTRRKIRHLSQRTHQARIFALELMREAIRRKRLGLFFDLGYSLFKRACRRIFRK